MSVAVRISNSGWKLVAMKIVINKIVETKEMFVTAWIITSVAGATLSAKSVKFPMIPMMRANCPRIPLRAVLSMKTSAKAV